MSPWQTLRTALRAVLRNKMRSFLTMLGIIIGVSAVIAMVALGEGAKARVSESFASMGTSLLIVMPGTTTAGGAHGGWGSMPTLTWEDLEAIRNEVSTVRAAAALLRTTAQVASEDQNWSTSVTGTSPEYFEIRGWSPADGTLFSAADVDSATKVAVLGQTVVDRLYGPTINPVSRTVRIKNIPFRVVGVLERKGQSPVGHDYDDAVFVPQSTFQGKIQAGLQKFISGVIFVGATAPDETARAHAQITSLLRDRHHIEAGVDDDFSIRNMTEMASAQQEGMKTLGTLLASVAAVSLVVGGIGIMNIMLVSVTERTREIGLRMAVGAKPRDILSQFLVEALTLSLAGGMLGVVLGISAAAYLAGRFDWPVLVTPDIVTLAFGFSAAVGAVFGLYPAHKASQLDPIEALRYE